MPRQLQQRRRVAYQTAVIIESLAWTELVIAAAFIFFVIPWTRDKHLRSRVPSFDCPAPPLLRGRLELGITHIRSSADVPLPVRR